MTTSQLQHQIQKIGITYESIVLILMPAAQSIVMLFHTELTTLTPTQKTFLLFSFCIAGLSFAAHITLSFLKKKERIFTLRKIIRICVWVLTTINIVENQLIPFEDTDDMISRYISLIGAYAFMLIQLFSISGKNLRVAFICCTMIYFALRVSINRLHSILAVLAGLLCLVTIRFFILIHRTKSSKSDRDIKHDVETVLLKVLLASTEEGFVIVQDKRSVYYANPKSYELLDVIPGNSAGSLITGLENLKRFDALSCEDQANLKDEVLGPLLAKVEPKMPEDNRHSSFSIEFGFKNRSSPRESHNASEQAFQEDQPIQSPTKSKAFFTFDSKNNQGKLSRKNSHASHKMSHFKPRSKLHEPEKEYPRLRSFLKSFKTSTPRSSKTLFEGLGNENTHENHTTANHLEDHNVKENRKIPFVPPSPSSPLIPINIPMPKRSTLGFEEGVFKDGIPEDLYEVFGHMKPENITYIDSLLNSEQIAHYIANEPKTHVFEDIAYIQCSESTKLLEVKLRPVYIMRQPFLVVQMKDITQRESYNALKQSEKEKADMLSSVTHELRTPLNCIITMLDMVEDYVSDDLKDDYIAPANQSAKMLLNLINDILDYAQTKEKTLKLTFSHFNLERNLMDIVKLMQFQARSKGLDLYLEFNKKIPAEVYSEPNRLRQIVINLIGNAIKFTMKGEVKVKVDYTEPSLYRISVKDTGVGIKPDDLKSLFRKFSKVGETGSINQQGVGLGLAISTMLAKLLNPQGNGIKVESTFGKGTTFSFEIESDYKEPVGFDISSDEEDKKNVIDNINELKEQYNYAQNQKNKVFNKSKTSLFARGMSIFSKIQSSAQLNTDKDMSASILYPPDSKFEFEPMRQGSKDYHARSTPYVDQKSNLKAEQSFFIQKTFQTSHFSEENLVNPQSSQRTKGPSEKRNFAENSKEKDKVLTELVRRLNEEYTDPYLLVVDDNAFNIVALKKVLEIMKIRIDSAVNGDIAIQKIKERKKNEDNDPNVKNYKLVLMDCNMPVKDGYETTKEIRYMEIEKDMPRMPIIAVTASGSPRDMRRCFDIGMDDHLTKPISFDGLKDILIKYLSQDITTDNVD